MKIFNLIITTKKKEDEKVKCFIKNASQSLNRDLYYALQPVLKDLEKLRANTWDQDKITNIQFWLLLLTVKNLRLEFERDKK